MPVLKRWAIRSMVAIIFTSLGCASLIYMQRDTIRLAGLSYVYGYPLVLSALTQDSFSRDMAPLNQLVHVPAFPDASFREVVRPNVDTLYSLAWLDMQQGPWVLQIPATERYQLIQLLDGWSNVFASLGPRTSGREAQQLLLAGPHWQGEVPAGMQLLRAPTRLAWMLSRIQTNGSSDYPAVHTIQQQLRLSSLGDWKAGHQVPGQIMRRTVSPQEPPLYQMRNMSAEQFFTRLSALLADNPPAAADAPAIENLQQLGVNAASPVEHWSLLRRCAAALGIWLAEREMRNGLIQQKGGLTGWRQPPMNIGAYGTDYGLRAVVSMVGFGANLAADAVYLNATEDMHGETLQGGRRYRLHFATGQLPPVKAFWSITAYDSDGFLIANPENRYALGDRDPLQHNPDGSLDLYLQSEPPAQEHRPNWLPIPTQGTFSLTARLYWPQDSILNGHWQMPGLTRQEH